MANAIDRVQVKVSLLRLLNECPEVPSVNTPTTEIESQKLQLRRTFSFKPELSITQELTFICVYSDDPLHVTAVCLEEARNSHSLTIIFAANTGIHDKLIGGLKKTSKILEVEDRQGSLVISNDKIWHQFTNHSALQTSVNCHTNGEAMLMAIVKLNHARILSRLWSKHTINRRVKTKPSLLHRLLTAKVLLLDLSATGPHAQNMVDDIENLQDQSVILEAMESCDSRSSKSYTHILNLVTSIQSVLLYYGEDFQHISYNPICWTSNATEALIDRLRKISQYARAGDELLRAAQGHKIFSNITVEFGNI
jgi:hypothetical protein